MNVPTRADALADAKRAFRPGYTIISVVWVLAYFIAMNVLARPTVSASGRLFWFILPLPLLAIGYWSWTRYYARTDELMRRLEEQAALFAFRGSLFAFTAITLVAAWHHQPVDGVRSLGLVDVNTVWQLALLLPMLLHGVGFLLAHRRLFPRK